ncbi:MAG TPA: class I SAM-dependent methyltransferase [Stellaceae bacterium]|nr:class I SAM-dependent methyltransferase [Stellaceae bacterium]
MLPRFVKANVKAIMQQNPALFNPIWERVYPILRRGDGRYAANGGGSMEEVFTRIYDGNGWGSRETRSGYTSELGYTRVVRGHIERLLRDYKVRVFFDCPCGDFNWMSKVRLPEDTRYIGGEIVPELVADLERRYHDGRHDFVRLNIVDDPLPQADMWMCRTVLFHFPNAEVIKVLRNFARSPVGLLLATQYEFPKENADVETGGFRPYNLRLPPFNLPPPLARVPDFVAPAPPRYLALWSRAQVASALRD